MRILAISFCAIVIAVASAVGIETSAMQGADFSRYEAILIRKPFGEQPAEAGQGAPGAPAAESFIKKIKLVAITEGPEGETKVGFVDIVSNKYYYLKVGESEDEIEVLDADYEMETAVLKKGSEECEITMAGAIEGGAAPEGGAGGGVVLSQTGKRESPVERLRKRREAMRHKKKEPPSMKPEEMEEHLKQTQMDLIRNSLSGDGPPPLPMELTPEMDDQLVAEGVLPPNTGEEVQTEEQPAEQ